MSKAKGGLKCCSSRECHAQNPQPVEMFYRDATRGDGYMFKCRACTRGKVKARQEARRFDKRMTQAGTGCPYFLGKYPTGKRQDARHPWTVDQVRFLEEYYGAVPDEWLTKQLQRSWQAIIVKAWKIGVQKKDNALCARTCGAIFGVNGNTVRRWIRAGYLRVEKSRSYHATSNMVAWDIRPDPLEEFMREYPWLYDYRRIDDSRWPLWYVVGREAWERYREEGGRRMPSGARLWTGWEDAYLINWHGRKPRREIAEWLRRTEVAVQTHLTILRQSGRLIPRLPSRGRHSARTEEAVAA